MKRTVNTSSRIGAVIIISTLLALGLILIQLSRAQNPRPDQAPPPPPTLGLEQGYLDLDSPDFKIKLVKTSQTVAALEPKAAPGFDFTPGDRLEKRSANGYHHIGDLTLRVRAADSGPWRKLDTAEARQPVQSLETAAPTLARADLTPTLPADSPIQVTRSWIVEDGRLTL